MFTFYRFMGGLSHPKMRVSTRDRFQPWEFPLIILAARRASRFAHNIFERGQAAGVVIVAAWRNSHEAFDL